MGFLFFREKCGAKAMNGIKTKLIIFGGKNERKQNSSNQVPAYREPEERSRRVCGRT
jgi:hypothetical protein